MHVFLLASMFRIRSQGGHVRLPLLLSSSEDDHVCTRMVFTFAVPLKDGPVRFVAHFRDGHEGLEPRFTTGHVKTCPAREKPWLRFGNTFLCTEEGWSRGAAQDVDLIIKAPTIPPSHHRKR